MRICHLIHLSREKSPNSLAEGAVGNPKGDVENDVQRYVLDVSNVTRTSIWEVDMR